MAKLSQAQEPSMEEILASIRRIISEDDADPIAPPPPRQVAATIPVPPSAPAPALSTDAIDALFAVRPVEAKSTAPVAPPTRPEPRPASPQSVASQPAQLIRAPAAPSPRPEMAAPRPDPLATHRPASRPQPAAAATRSEDPVPGRPLLSAGADAAVNAAFGNLAGTVLSSGDPRTLEDLVKEMLRPMLKAWLDSNLPPLVERLVRDEIERVSRGR